MWRGRENIKGKHMGYVRSTTLLQTQFPPNKRSMDYIKFNVVQSKAMKTITVSTPNQECIGCELMCVGTAGKLEQRQRE